MEHSLARIRYQRQPGTVKELLIIGDDKLIETLSAITVSLEAIGVRILGVEMTAHEVTLVPQRDPLDAPTAERRRVATAPRH